MLSSRSVSVKCGYTESTSSEMKAGRGDGSDGDSSDAGAVSVGGEESKVPEEPEESKVTEPEAYNPVKEEKMAEKEVVASDEEEGSESDDDPDRLWCICQQPHNDRSADIMCPPAGDRLGFHTDVLCTLPTDCRAGS